MTYWLIMFVQPKPVPDPGAMKYRITKARYEELCNLENPVVDCDKGNFSVIAKRIFSSEPDNAAFVVTDVVKNRKE